MISNTFKATLTLDGQEFLINSMSINYTLNGNFPSSTITIGSDDHNWIAGEIAEYYYFPVVQITIDIGDGELVYDYQGIITSVNGSESQSGMSNSLTVMPASYYASMRVGSFDGTNNPAYLEDAAALANDVIAHFNANVFPGITGLIWPIELSPVDVPPAYNRLLIAPRFIGMTLVEILDQIFGAYGYSTLFTWDDQVIIGSLNNPIDSPVIITKDMIGENSFRDDVALNIANIGLGW